ncbi:[LysW]-aminoadipate kinase [Candidatus Woesearchaeota archaeon]|nr:[LysW]-aminoadipate kinase [Candidatus Woesearchaeota archaeon]
MIIIKIGGGKAINTEGVIKDLAGLDEPFIIVHGANYFRDKLAEELGTPKKTITSVSGYSSVYSDDDAIDNIMMAYAGLRNKRIVELCQLNNINAVGLSGIDGGLIRAKRNQGIRAREGNKVKLLRDFSGKPFQINVGLLKLLLDNNYLPVLCIPVIDEEGYAVNTENDDIVRVLKDTLGAETIINLIEAPGFLEDKDDPTTLVKKMSKDELEKRESQVEGRMKRKILALRKLFEKGDCRVIISDGRVECPVKDALDGKGTVIE